MAERSSLAPSPDYMSDGLPDPDPCSCDEALALRARLTRAEAELQELKSRLLHERDAVGPASTPVVTPADNAVLVAVGSADTWALRLHHCQDTEGTWTHAAAKAELARRGLT